MRRGPHPFWSPVGEKNGKKNSIVCNLVCQDRDFVSIFPQMLMPHSLNVGARLTPCSPPVLVRTTVAA